MPAEAYPRFKHWQCAPYGHYIEADGAVVIHDRRGRPLARIVEGEAHILPEPEWIEFVARRYYYRDPNSPRRDAETRRRIREIFTAYPAILAEVTRRMREQKRQ